MVTVQLLFEDAAKLSGEFTSRAGVTGGNSNVFDGLSWKLAGRVGDSPILGAGLYVDNDVGAAGSTGRGEANLLDCCSFLAVEFMRQGMHPKDACLAVMRRVAAKTVDARLLREDGTPNFSLNFYALNKAGEYGGANFRPSRVVGNEGGESRHEDSAYLWERDQ